MVVRVLGHGYEEQPVLWREVGDGVVEDLNHELDPHHVRAPLRMGRRASWRRWTGATR
jgi:hypothetical protein